jgi:hypothetical protein
MLLPAGIGCTVFGLGVYFAWWMATLYVFLLGLLMRRRFRAGHWKALRVIEAPLTPDASASAGSAPPSSAAGPA